MSVSPGLKVGRWPLGQAEPASTEKGAVHRHEQGFRLRQPTDSPARRHSAATVRAAWAVNAPGVCDDAHVSRATAPQRLICCAPVAAGIVT